MNHNGMRIAVFGGIVALCCSGSAFAGQDGGTASGSGTAAKDKMFLAKAAEGSMAEIQMSQLALKKTKNDDVKMIAQKMVDDHTKLMGDMKPFCEKMSVMPPTKLNAKHQQMAARLKGMSGDKFDKEYMQAMVGDHHKDLGEFQAEEKSTSDAELKSTVTQATQVIQAHTEMIDQSAQKMGLTVPPMPAAM